LILDVMKTNALALIAVKILFGRRSPEKIATDSRMGFWKKAVTKLSFFFKPKAFSIFISLPKLILYEFTQLSVE